MNLMSLLWYFLPAYIANMTPVLVRNIPVFAAPVDFGRKLAGTRLFGEHKTWRGLFFGTLFGGFSFILQQTYRIVPWELFDYSAMPPAFGFMLAFGALFGDLIKSFFKRRLGIKSGKPWYIIDQIDYVLGGLLFSSYYFLPSRSQITLLLSVSIVLTILTNHVSEYLKIRNEKW